jgi:two-component system phosphoglycerate transport system response regulator PgtA
MAKSTQSILIVEDDADLVETYTDLLESHHYTVSSAARANDAIALVTRLKPSIVLLDLNLAGHSGTLVINMIRSYTPLKCTKIVVVTGHPEMLKGNHDAQRVDLILTKPVSNEMLLETVNRFLSTAAS